MHPLTRISGTTAMFFIDQCLSSEWALGYSLENEKKKENYTDGEIQDTS